MTISLKESRACSEMARALYDFLPGSGSRQWTGHITFRTVAEDAGVGQFWQGGSKEPAIAAMLERTLQYRRDLFEPLILGIVRAGIRYRQKGKNPITEAEIKTLNGLILEVGFKFPAMWDPSFLSSLRMDGTSRASQIVEQELATERLHVTQQADWDRKREQLRAEFYRLAQQSDRNQAGLEFEKLLNGMFELAELKPRKPFRVVGEQIDGSFDLDNEVYLVEAKWESKPLSEAPLLVFRGKVEGKSQFTRGLFISMYGVTEEAKDAISRGKQPNFFLVDGYDLTTVMEGRIELVDLLRGKLRRLAEEGKVFVSARDFM